MTSFKLGDVVQMEDGEILEIYMQNGYYFYGVKVSSRFPRFVSEKERIYINPKKVRKHFRMPIEGSKP